MLSLAVFYFVFLGTEYLFDNRMALYTDPTGVVLAQSYILGVSALGFLAYSLIEKWKSKSGNPTAFKAARFFLPVPVIAGYVLLFAGTGYRVQYDGGTTESGRSGIGAGSGTGSEPDRSQRGWHELGNKEYGIYQSDYIKSWN